MEEELLVSQAKTNAIQLGLQAIMSKLEINTDEPREESEDILFAEESEVPSFGAGQARVKPASPSDFDRDQEKGRAFLNTCHIHFSICGDSFKGDQACVHWSYLSSNQTEPLILLPRSYAQSRGQGDGTTRIGQPLRESLRNCSAQRMSNSQH